MTRRIYSLAFSRGRAEALKFNTSDDHSVELEWPVPEPAPRISVQKIGARSYLSLEPVVVPVRASAVFANSTEWNEAAMNGCAARVLLIHALDLGFTVVGTTSWLDKGKSSENPFEALLQARERRRSRLQ